MSLPLAALTFSATDWAWVILLAAAVLLPLAWWALRPAAPQRGALAVGLGLRMFGIGLLAWCLLEPQWTSLRPQPGANVLAVLADNSQGLQLSDRGAAASRGETLRDRLTTAEGWPAALDEQYQVRRYSFDRELRRVAGFEALDFRGERTDLGAALTQLRARLTDQPVAGIVLFTDGNATDLPDGVGALAGLPPVYPVVVGSEDGLTDVWIERTDLRQTAFDDAPVTLRVEVAATGLAVHDVDVAVRPLARADRAPAADAPPAQRVRLPADGSVTAVEFNWRPDGAGAQFHEVSVTAVGAPEEATLLNNRRLVLTDAGREAYRLLYVGGQMNWEFKFLNRALAEDARLQLVGLLRLAHREPKFVFRGRAGEARNPLFRGFGGVEDDTTRYDQPVLTRLNTRDAAELRGGFPRTAEELFGYDAVVLDNVEAAFFSPDQLLLLRRFVSERGGGLLTLGGVDTLENGGYRETTLAAALPVYLDRLAAKPPTGELAWQLTREGWLQPWTRVRAQEAEERARLNEMPRFLVANALAGVKPGATVLATLADETGETYPALVAQPFGRGRVATLAVGDFWRWGLSSAAGQEDLARFWRQIARWLVTDVAERVELQTNTTVGEPGLELRATVREADHRLLDTAQVRVTVRAVDPSGAATDVAPTLVLPTEPAPESPGRYTVRFQPRERGAYVATAEAVDRGGELIGRAEAAWVHDPAAEEFRSLRPNRPLLQELARQTGGAVLTFPELNQLEQRLTRTAALVMEPVSRPLWHNGWVFLAVLGCFIGEWGWRRWRGLP